MSVGSRATAPSGGSARGWTSLRTLGARGVPTQAARTNATPSELLVVQQWAIDDEGASLREARALVSLRHPNVVKVREVLEQDGEATMISQFVDGESLGALRRAAAAKGTRIPLAIELRILVDLLSGLAALHGAKDAKLKPLQFVHGEVSIANVIVGTDGVARVVQLGGIHAIAGAQAIDTLPHLAPEVLLADDAIDQRADIYGVGVMLWEALAGGPLFTETNAGAIVTRHLSGRIRKATVPDGAAWAEGLVDLAQKAIATDPVNRIATANELATEIKRIAKINLAPTAKVAALVKELAGATIEARRTALLGASAASTGARPKVNAPARPAPAPADPAATTKPIPEETDTGWSIAPPSSSIAVASTDLLSSKAPSSTSEDVESIDLVSVGDDDDHEESGLKPAVRPPVRAVPTPPKPVRANAADSDPSVHDRITHPTPIDPRAIDASRVDDRDSAVVPVVIAPMVPVGAVPAPSAVAPPPPPAPVVAAPTPAPSAVVPTPAPLPAFAPVALDRKTPEGEPSPVVLTPFGAAAPVPTSVPRVATQTAPVVDPLAVDEVPPVDEDARKKRRFAVLLLVAALFLLTVVVFAFGRRHHPVEASNPPPHETAVAAKTTQPTEQAAVPAATTATTTTSEPTATAAVAAAPTPPAEPSTTATETAAATPPAATGTAPAVAAPAVTAPAEPPHAGPKNTGSSPGPTKNSKPKPGTTYDPLGI